VCFDERLRSFRCDDPLRLDVTFRALFERIDALLRNEFPRRRAKIVFDNVDRGTDHARAEAITNFLNRTTIGRGYDTIIPTPFFSVSQAQSVGVQLADFVTTVYGMRFQGHVGVRPFFRDLKRTLYTYHVGARRLTSLRVFRGARDFRV
jgi:hypothetical protein